MGNSPSSCTCRDFCNLYILLVLCHGIEWTHITRVVNGYYAMSPLDTFRGCQRVDRLVQYKREAQKDIKVLKFLLRCEEKTASTTKAIDETVEHHRQKFDRQVQGSTVWGEGESLVRGEMYIVALRPQKLPSTYPYRGGHRKCTGTGGGERGARSPSSVRDDTLRVSHEATVVMV